MKFAVVPLLLAGLMPSAAGHAAVTRQVQASHAWIRVLPGALPAGAYVTLQNDGAQAMSLTGASSTAYGQVMLHHSSTGGGMSRMTMVDALVVPAHGSVVLAPAGYHLMLMQAKTPVKPGDVVTLQLEFADGSSLPTAFIARPANALDAGENATPPMDHGAMHPAGDH